MPIVRNPADTATATSGSGLWRAVHIIGEPSIAGFKLVRVAENLHSQAVDTLSRVWAGRKFLAKAYAEGDSYVGPFAVSQSVMKREETQDFQLTLTLTKVHSSTDSKSWHYDDADLNPQHPVTRLIRRSPFFDPRSVDTFIPAQTGKSIVNPKLDCSHYPGTFYIKHTDAKEANDGTITLTQDMTQPWGDTRLDCSVKNAFGISHLGVENRNFQYHDYLPTTLPANPSPATGFKFVEARTTMDDAGFLQKKVVHEKSSPSNVVTAGIPATQDTLAIPAFGTEQTGLNNAGRELTIVADRIDPTKAPSVVNAWAINDSNYKVADISTEDYQDGSGRAMKKVFRFNRQANFFVSKGCDSSAGRVPTKERTWPFVEDTKADKLMAGPALQKWKWVGDTFAGGVARRTIHFGTGLSTIVQESQKYSYGGHTTTKLWPMYNNQWQEKKIQWRRIRKNGDEVDQVRAFTILHRFLQTNNSGLAYDWLDCTFSGTRFPIAPGKVEDHSTGLSPRFRAWAQYWSVDSWATAASEYTDLGENT